MTNLVCPKCNEDHPCKCERQEETEEKTWESYRFEEMEEKAGLQKSGEVEYPELDMDGCRFVPYLSEKEETAMDDAYTWSISWRLNIRCTNIGC